jgi:hypothetical protein
MVRSDSYAFRWEPPKNPGPDRFALAETARAILETTHPMTLRQIFYALVVGGHVVNTVSKYNALKKLLTQARYGRFIPFEWIIDPSRLPRRPAMWDDVRDFAAVADQYRASVWETQPEYFEVWLEKDALSRIFEDVLEPYGVTLNVGRGYDSTSSIGEGAKRLDAVTVLYFGDFDPRGLHMIRSFTERLDYLDCGPDIVKCAITLEDIGRYNLPPQMAKEGDKLFKRHVAEYGNVSVELDALPIDVLRDRLRTEVEARMDLRALAAVHERDEHDRTRIREALEALTEGE